MAVSDTPLRVASDLAFPLGLVVQKMAILARSGAGKTNTAVDIVEEVLDARQQVVVIDPPGHWWGLRASADGKKPGYPVAVLGGIHADVPLESTAGVVLADLVVDEGLSTILDLSEFTDGEIARFVAAFAQRLYARKNTNRDPMLLVLEEADELAPQNLPPREKDGGNAAMMLHHIERIAKRGRGRGIGMLAISQRSAALNKHVLSQIECLIAMQTTAPQDIAAINDWIKGPGMGDPEYQQRQRQLLAEIAGLPIGSGFVWSPSWLRIFRKVSFRKRRTFDSSATPEPGKRQVAPKTLADVDLAALTAKMATTIERARADDPRELRRQIADLQRQLRDQAHHTVDVVSSTHQRLERELAVAQQRIAELEARPPVPVPVLEPEQRTELATAVQAFESAADRAVSAANLIDRALKAAGAIASRAPRPEPPRARPVEAVRQPRDNLPTPPPLAPRPDGQQEVTGVSRRILDAVASFESIGVSAVPRVNVAIQAGYQHPRSKGFVNALGALRTAGLIDYPSANRVGLTNEGRAMAQPGQLRSLDDLHRAWFDQIGPKRAQLLRALMDAPSMTLAREDLAAAVGYEHVRSKGFVNALGALRSLGAIDYPASGMVAMTDLLFPPLPNGLPHP